MLESGLQEAEREVRLYPTRYPPDQRVRSESVRKFQGPKYLKKQYHSSEDLAGLNKSFRSLSITLFG